MFIEGDHPSMCASAPRSSQAIAWDKSRAAEQLKGKNVEGFGCGIGLSWLLGRQGFEVI